MKLFSQIWVKGALYVHQDTNSKITFTVILPNLVVCILEDKQTWWMLFLPHEIFAKLLRLNINFIISYSADYFH